MYNIAAQPIAIIGLSCRLPGADNPAEFWEMLREGRSGLGELPPERLDRELQYHPEMGRLTKSYTTLGGIVPPRPLDRQICPLPQSMIERAHIAHLTLCEVAARAFDHAGLDAFHLPNRNVGTYIGHTSPNAGVGDVTYARMIEQTAQYLREVDGFGQLTGGDQDAAIQEIVDSVRRPFAADDKRLRMWVNAYHGAALITRAFALDGPSMVFDAACASSFRALVHGVRALQRGQIDMAVVGGASYCQGDTLVLFSRAQSVSARGSRPFDEGADGLVASEGYVVLILKTLEQALADNDPIQAVLRSISVSSDGKGKSLWAPRKEGQIEAMRRAYADTRDLESLGYVEMHATSTQVGDATELIALAEFLGPHLPAEKKLPIGGVKANIGHTLETAGLAGLLKTILAMQNGFIPPQINIEQLNTNIDWQKAPFFVPREGLKWPPPGDGLPRRAAVNAFGIGGLNVHVTLDEHVPEASQKLVERLRVESRELRTHGEGLSTLNPRPSTLLDSQSIAIIGMGAVLPGVRTMEAMWDTLSSARDQKSSVPPGRWTDGVGYEPGADRNWTVPIKIGGFITDFQYDWKKHKVPPKQVMNADVLQFMLLDAADEALRDAGYLEKPFDKTRTGVIVGTIFGGEFVVQLQMGLRLPDFRKRLFEVLARRGVADADIERVALQYEEVLLKHMPALIDETGSFTASSLSSRITKTFDLMGGGVSLDSGDTSAPAALNCAIDLLLAGDCDMMICAAGQRAMDFGTFDMFARGGVLARTKPNGPFDADSDGAVPGEGVGVVILKRLADARRDGDRIHAIIRGLGVSREASLDKSVAAAVRRSMKAADLSPDEVSLVECGSCGWPDFDRQEISGLASAYVSENRTDPLEMGAVAGQMGNTCGASGMVSLLKAITELNHLQMPPNVGMANPLPSLAQHAATLKPAFHASGLSTPNDDGRLFAGVSSYSQHEVAYHLLVEGAVKKSRELRVESREPDSESFLSTLDSQLSTPQRPSTLLAQPFGDWRIARIGAGSFDELVEKTRRIASDAEAAFGRLSSSIIQCTFTPKDRYRLAIVADNAGRLARGCELAIKQRARRESLPLLAERGVFYGCLGPQTPRVAFMFPGQGSQYTGMLKLLVTEFPPAAAAMRDMDTVLERHQLPTFAKLAWEEDNQLGADVWRTQLSLLIADTIVCASVRALGLSADRVSGHSFGELVALVAADAWTFEDALLATRARCAAIEGCTSGAGIMLSTAAPASVLRRLLREIDGRVFISHENGPEQTVVAGDEAAVSQLAEKVKQAGFRTNLLDVPAAFHTPLMKEVKQPFAEALSKIPVEPPRIPVLSSVTNKYVSEPAEIRKNLVDQMTQPVRYVELVQRLIAEGTTVLVEVGPRRVLTGLHRQIAGHGKGDRSNLCEAPFGPFRQIGPVPFSVPRNRQLTMVACDHRKRGGLEQLLFVRASVEATGAVDAIPARDVPRIESREELRVESLELREKTRNLARDSQPSTRNPSQPATLNSSQPSTLNPQLSTLQDGLKILRLQGTPYEMGVEHGRRLAEPIRTVLRRYADLAGSRWDRLDEKTRCLTRQADLFFSAADLEEFRGIADGAAVNRSSLIAHNLRLYHDGGAGGLHFAVTAGSNPGDGLVHAANEELQFGLSIRDCLERFVFVRRPADGAAYVTFGVAGQVGGLSGINAHGLAVSTAALLDARRPGEPDGRELPTVLVKNILEKAQDIGAAVKLIEKSRTLGSWSICLSHSPTDSLCYLEYDGENLNVLPSVPSVVASNHRLISPSGSGTPVPSKYRLERLKNLLGADELSVEGLELREETQNLALDSQSSTLDSSRPFHVSVSRAQRILQDRFDLKRGREVTRPTVNTIHRVDNQVSIVIEPRQGNLWVTPGPLSNGRQSEFSRLKLSDLLGIAECEIKSRESRVERKNGELCSRPATLLSRPFHAVSNADLVEAFEKAASGPSNNGNKTVCSRFVMRMTEQPLGNTGQKPLPLDGPVLILGDNPVAQALSQQLERQHAQVLRLPAADDIVETLSRLDDLWRSSPAPHLFLLSAYDDDAVTTLGNEGWTTRRARGVMLPYRVCQRWYQLVLEAGLVEKSSVFAATALGGDFGFSGNVHNIEGGALAGLIKGIKLELEMTGGQKRFQAKIVDAAADMTPEDIAQAVCQEFASKNDESEIGYCGGCRYVVRPMFERLESRVESREPDSDFLLSTLDSGPSTVVITGGARGVTAVVARALAARYGAKLNLIGSSPLPEIPDGCRDLSDKQTKQLKARMMKEAVANKENPIETWTRFEKALEIDNTLRLFADAGLRATYHSCDVSDREALARVLEKIRAVDGPIQGIIHGAGFERASRFDRKQPALVDRTIAAKVDGAAALMELTRQDPVRFFAAFGSTSGRFGGVGQTDYCMANELLAKLTDWYRRQRPDCHATVFHWHAWDDVGMAVRPESLHIRKLHNIQYMPSPEGVEHLIEELRAGLPEGEVLITEPGYYEQRYIDPAKTALAEGSRVESRELRERTRNVVVDSGPSTLNSGPSTLVSSLPLIDSIADIAAGRRVTAQMRLDPTVDVFLTQHRYKGRAMLPVVIAVESLAETVSLLLAGDERIVGLKNIEILNGMRFLNDDPQTAQIHAVRNSEGFLCRLTSDFTNRSGKLLQKDRPYLQGIVETAVAESEICVDPPTEPSTTWNKCGYFENDNLIYHGAAFRCLKQITGEGHVAYGRLLAPDLGELGGTRRGTRWVLPPALLDACFFASSVYLWYVFKSVVAIPSGIDHIRLGRQQRTGEGCLVEVHFRGRGSEFGIFDFTLFGEDGSMILQVEGYKNVIVGQESTYAV